MTRESLSIDPTHLAGLPTRLIELLEEMTPSAAVGTYLVNTTRPEFRNPIHHRETYRQVMAMDEHPRFEDAVDMLFYSEIVGLRDRALHQEVFGRSEILGQTSDIGICKGLSEDNTYNVLTVQFIDALAAELDVWGARIEEVTAGKGKLAHLLRKRGFNITATDAHPANSYVQKKTVEEVLSGRPSVVLSSWLDSTGPDLQRQILDCPSVELYVEVRNGSRNGWIGVDDSGEDHPHFDRYPASDRVQRYSLPIDILQRPEVFEDRYAALLNFRFRTFEYTQRVPTVFLWERR